MGSCHAHTWAKNDFMSFCPLFIVVKSNSSDKEKMTLTKLDLTLKKYDFKSYTSKAEECTKFFEGVYAYGCPGKRLRRWLSVFEICMPIGRIGFAYHNVFW